jgi:hypothetical protein
VEHRLEVVAWDSVTRSRRSSRHTLTVRIEGANTHAPVFEQPGYWLRLTVASRPGTDTGVQLRANGLFAFQFFVVVFECYYKL